MLTIETGTTNKAKEFVLKNFESLGEISAIEHSRSKGAEFVTIIRGNKDSMTVIGGLTSVYDGEGPKGLAKVLTTLGVSEQAADRYAKDRESYKKGFTHVF